MVSRSKVAKLKITNERTEAIGRYLNVKTPWKPEDEEPPTDTSTLQQQTRQELKSALTDAEFESLLSELETRCTEARKAWDAYHFPKRVSELENALSGAGSNPGRPLTDARTFLAAMTNTYPTISQVKFIGAQNTIEAARKKALTAYADSIAGKWNVNGSKPPEFDAKKIRSTILTEAAVTDEEYQAFYSGMNTRFTKVKQEWDVGQKKLVENFSVEGDPEKIIRDYGEFFDEHGKNPYLAELTTKVDQALQEYFRNFIGDYLCKDDMNETQRRFNKFTKVCRTFGGKGLEGNPILLTPSGKFAMLCNIRGKLNDLSRGIYSVFDQRIRVYKIEAKVHIKGCSDNYRGLDMAVNLGTTRWNFEKQDWETVSLYPILDMKETSNSKGEGRIPQNLNGSWQTIWSGQSEGILFGPYMIPFMHVFFEDRLNGLFSNNVKGSKKQLFVEEFSKTHSTIEFPDTEISLRHAVYDSTVGVLQLRVTGERIGDNYHDLAKESGLIR